MKQFILISKVIDVEHLNNSTAGNPRYLLTLNNGGADYTARTKINGRIGYLISWQMLGGVYEFKAHYTKKGVLVLDDFNY